MVKCYCAAEMPPPIVHITHCDKYQVDSVIIMTIAKGVGVYSLLAVDVLFIFITDIIGMRFCWRV